jgi:hypothetical protein
VSEKTREVPERAGLEDKPKPANHIRIKETATLGGGLLAKYGAYRVPSLLRDVRNGFTGEFVKYPYNFLSRIKLRKFSRQLRR